RCLGESQTIAVPFLELGPSRKEGTEWKFWPDRFVCLDDVREFGRRAAVKNDAVGAGLELLHDLGSAGIGRADGSGLGEPLGWIDLGDASEYFGVKRFRT